MTENFFVSVIITLVQIGDTYLRYLPFSREMSAQEVAELKKKILLWSVFGFALNVFLFSDAVNYRAYKISLLIGWIPYFALSLTVIRKKIPQHVFVVGMQSLWSFMLHAFAAMGVALLFGTMAEEYLPLQLTFCLLMFAALLKLERKFIMKILPSPTLFKDPSLKWGISVLPLAIFIGTVMPIVEITFMPTWKDRFSRLCLPVFFLLIYRAMSITMQHVKETQQQKKRTQLLQQQMNSLVEHNELIQKSRREVDELQKNLSENYSVIDSLLAEGKVSEAMQFIRRQGNLLDSTRVEIFCAAPLINAAFSIYFRRATAVGIKINHKINLPAKFATDENDLAVLLSNLLENAINASKLQPPDARELSVIIQQEESQYVLEISNRYDFPIKFDDNGLPCTAETGHGLGMTSLELFAKKYDAFVDFEHKNNFVRVLMYWHDEFSDEQSTA